jgi:hypothetical protein
MNIYILLITVAQLAWVAYRWRNRTPPVPFVVVGLAVLGTWAVVLSTPLETHAVVIDMPRGGAELATTVGAFTPVAAAVVTGLLFIGINQLILLGVRAAVNRFWSREGSTNVR